MKKILISVLIILLLILNYFAFARGISFLKIKSINDIKNASNNLGSSFNEANVLSNKTYPTEVENLERAIKQLKISKQEYENKKTYNADENLLGAIEIKTYKIHYLWTILGNYRKDRGVQSLTLDLKSTETTDVYDLDFTLIGEYTKITDFLYDIENDEQLNFDIKNTKIEPYTIKTTTTIIDGDNPKNTTTKQDNPYDKITQITETNEDGSLSNVTTEATQTTETNQTTEENNQSNTTNSTKQENNKNKIIIYDPKLVQVSFRVDNIGITLD